jgi:uncharacterized protein YlxW (UPF0749 family)
MAWKFNPFTGNLDFTNSGADEESVQDIIGAALIAGPGITVVYDDPGNVVTISANSVDLISYSQYGGF